MGGTVNTTGSGLYGNIEPIIPGLVGFTMAPQQILQPSCSNVQFEDNPIDTKASVHPVTIPIPGIPGLITGTAGMSGTESLNSSSIFSINNSAVNCSDALKLQNIGNCPISPMIMPTSSNTSFFVST
jgi:hypothetical protein